MKRFIRHITKNKYSLIALIISISCLSAVMVYSKARADEPISDQEIADTLSATVVKTTSKATGKIIIKWKKVENADGYTLLRAKKGSNKYTTLDNAIDALSFTDTTAKAGNTYSYKVLPEYGEGLGPDSEPAEAECFKFSIATPYATMYKGGSVTPNITFKGTGKLKFISSDTTVAKVSKSGRITGKKLGKAIVTASYRDISIDIDVLIAAKAIDVSRWEYTINWKKVKADGIGVAILKCTEGISLKDKTFEYNYKNAKVNGIKLGAYCFSRATTVKRAKAEAKYILKVLNGRKLQYSIVMDFESNAVVNATTKDVRTKMVLAFKKTVEQAGYSFALYTSPRFLNSYFNKEKFANTYLWLARYNGGKTYNEYDGPGKVIMWQWGGGKVDGISVSTDMNYIYPDVYKD